MLRLGAEPKPRDRSECKEGTCRKVDDSDDHQGEDENENKMRFPMPSR